MEKETHYYNVYQKVTTWKKDVFCINANSKEEADEAMRLLFLDNELHTGCENPTDALLTAHWCDHGDYYEGDDDLLTYEQNNNSPTEELYDEWGELLENNEPLEIKREKKLNNLLG
jgi:hypothetical protein